ncbi:hypothetical protein F5Y19DRAFT_139501 [Xylariaceae sp. FL1651]|nr:hypothetical protein F5Y19DRAFT_139501 [Xylariaceae sp. FL1651]
MDRNSDTSASAAQSRRPPYKRHNTGSDSQVAQVSDQQQQQNYRTKHQKYVVGGGAGRFQARVPSSRGLHKHHSQSTGKLNRRAPSPSPERPPMLAQTHRRATSDLRLTGGDSSSSNLNLKKNTPPSNFAAKRNRSHVEVAKRPKSTTSIKRSSSQKDVQKLKGTKSQVHFDLGNDGNDEEWVDASASASPYLSRRGSVVSGGQSPAKPPSPSDDSRPQTPQTDRLPDPRDSSPSRETAQHNNYITSRLLQRTPSHGAPPKMSTETVSVLPPSGSPTSQASHGPPSLYGTPKTSTLGASGQEELTSRFVSGFGPSSSGQGETGSYFVPTHAQERSEGVRRPQSLSNLHRSRQDSATDDEDISALAPRSRRSLHKAAPAGQSRTQQKLNLQRASSSMEPTQAGPGVGAVGASLLVGSTDYEHRDPRIGKLLERTGMEYLVVRRYQNPIARSIARLSHLPGANKNQRITKQNGMNGNVRGKDSIDLGGAGRLGLSQSMSDITRSRPVTPRRSASIRTNGARSSYDGDEDRPHDRMSGSSYMDGHDDGVAALLRNLWDKNMDLSASQD